MNSAAKSRVGESPETVAKETKRGVRHREEVVSETTL